jgi:hypothetical protein
MQQTPIAVGQNFLAGLKGGVQAGQNIRQANDQNALRNIFATQDINDPAVQQQIMGLDPRTGMALQNQTYQRGRQVKADARADETFKMRVDEYARGLSADEAAQTAAKVEQGLMAAIPLVESGNLDGLNQLFTQYGIDPVTSVEEATAALGQYQTVLGALKGVRDLNAGPKAADEYGRYAQEEAAAGRTPLSRIDYAQAKKGSETIFGPNGNPIVQRGGSNSKRLTEKQSQLALFGNMMNTTMPVINDLEEKFDPANLRDNIAARGGIVGNYIKSPEYRKYETAARAWGEGVLRIQTGAAATQSEIDRVFTTYFAQPGDEPEEVSFKRQLREAFAESIGVAGGGAVATPNSGDGQSGRDPEVTPFNPETPDFSQMSDEQLQAYIDGGGK